MSADIFVNHYLREDQAQIDQDSRKIQATIPCKQESAIDDKTF